MKRLLLIVTVLLVGCQTQTTVSDESFVVADLFSTPGKALATVELSPTPEPTNTLENQPVIEPTLEATLPLPTVVVLQQPTQPVGNFVPTVPPPTNTPDPNATPTVTVQLDPSGDCDSLPPMPFTPIWQNIDGVRAFLGCPQGSVTSYEVVFQRFERGFMFWREADEQIFVLSTDQISENQRTDRWWQFDDEYDGSEEPDLDPPAGLLQPVRGFGIVWRENGFVRQALGWATAPELIITIDWQEFDNGWMMHGPDGAPIFTMRRSPDDPRTGQHAGPLP